MKRMANILPGGNTWQESGLNVSGEDIRGNLLPAHERVRAFWTKHKHNWTHNKMHSKIPAVLIAKFPGRNIGFGFKEGKLAPVIIFRISVLKKF